MRNLFRSVLLIHVLTFNASSFAMISDARNFESGKSTYVPKIVKWVGEVRDESFNHTTEHNHLLEFVKKDNGKIYNIVESLELVKLHHETEKNYLVEIEAEKTPRFLFWGGNLIVKNFKVLSELDSVPRLAPVETVSSMLEIKSGKP